jgi:hypothetical protein
MPTAADQMERKLFWREFWLLWGVTVFLAAIVLYSARIPSSYFAMRLLIEGHPWGPLMFGVELLQSALVLAIAVGLGLAAAHSVGLGAPILENLLRGEPITSRLRAMVLPAVLVGALVAAVQVTTDLRVFHPNRGINHQLAEKIASEPRSPQLNEKLGRTSGPINHFTPVSMFLNEIGGILSGELIGRLFFVSGVAWVLTKILRDPSRPPGWGVLSAAILIAAALLTTSGFIASAETDRQLRAYLSDVLPNMPRDPTWSVVSRHLLSSVPAEIGLGWLYARWGLESAILAALVAWIVGEQLVLHVVVRFF